MLKLASTGEAATVINKVEICGVNTAKLPVPKNSQMRKLFAAMQNGDYQPGRSWITGNLRLVLKADTAFQQSGRMGVDDLFQVGCIGLMKALDNF